MTVTSGQFGSTVVWCIRESDILLVRSFFFIFDFSIFFFLLGYHPLIRSIEDN